jgi:hypothetical protein
MHQFPRNEDCTRALGTFCTRSRQKQHQYGTQVVPPPAMNTSWSIYKQDARSFEEANSIFERFEEMAACEVELWLELESNTQQQALPALEANAVAVDLAQYGLLVSKHMAESTNLRKLTFSGPVAENAIMLFTNALLMNRSIQQLRFQKVYNQAQLASFLQAVAENPAMPLRVLYISGPYYDREETMLNVANVVRAHPTLKQLVVYMSGNRLDGDNESEAVHDLIRTIIEHPSEWDEIELGWYPAMSCAEARPLLRELAAGDLRITGRVHVRIQRGAERGCKRELAAATHMSKQKNVGLFVSVD